MNVSEHWYVLDVNPEPWAIGPVGYRRHGGKMSAYVGRNTQLDTYKETIRESIKDEAVMMTGPVDVTFFFWRQQIAYTTPQARRARKHEVDATNMQKASEDALQGLCYDNDKDNHHVQSFVVEQGADVKSALVICIKPCAEFDEKLIPDDIWNKIEALEKVTAPASQAYGDSIESF